MRYEAPDESPCVDSAPKKTDSIVTGKREGGQYTRSRHPNLKNY